jgi:hypothetical protein
MAEQHGRASGRASGQLSVDGEPVTPAPAPPDGPASGQFSAVINIHNDNLNQIEVAIQANQHPLDPHPIKPGEAVTRHPVYLVAVDYSNLDAEGHPAEGKPAELNLQLIREVFSTRYAFVSPDGPPADGSHVRVDGMHFIAEVDSAGNPTGRMRLGNPEDVA